MINTNSYKRPGNFPMRQMGGGERIESGPRKEVLMNKMPPRDKASHH
jgi:hypothetical protein